MASPTSSGAVAPRENLPAGLRSALLLDLEVSLSGRILKLGAVLREETLLYSGSFALAEALAKLAKLADSATCVVGHNIVTHDLERLRHVAPDLRLLRLPVIDTLVLSPIAFPQRPYHHLVKDYKLVRASVNDPVADARQAGVLFADECRSLAGLRQTEPRMFALLHYLLATPDGAGDPLAHGLELFFTALGGTRPAKAEALEICRELFAQSACRSVPVDASLIQTNAQRLALAFALTWLRVSGSCSVLPPWVRLQHPQSLQLIQRLREVPCTAADCAYCRSVHNAREQLHKFFQLDDFRPVPANARGGSLQQDIVEAGLRDESLLAILPTGGGKSLCFQLPALVRNHRRGVLTIVISPLQALMKDQVDGLIRRTGTAFAAALYGMLTPPERGDVLRRVRMGDVALLYVSPEQLRNRSFQEAIAQREIGCWVFDEAHCLSKWGHDFRPDYLYAGRFIREFSDKQKCAIPAIACFTATAKNDVRDEIIAYFKTETGRDLALFEGGVERHNLDFEVQTVSGHEKLARVHDLLSFHLPAGQGGSAIVFRARRKETEVSSEHLRAKGWKAAHFHAGLTPPEKKRIQDEFLAGDIQVICATNAFGMGIDKDDVRLVIHADTPGSLENYLQEAGRAGRDGGQARCVLLYDEADCETQFRMGAFSELSRRDIAQILRGLRKATRRSELDEVVITTGEILRDEDVDTDIDSQDRSADTKVRTAIAWLERAGFLQRDENVTTVFQARLLVRDLVEAEAKMVPLHLSQSERGLWLAILGEIMNPASAEGLTVDRMALLPELIQYARAGAGAGGGTGAGGGARGEHESAGRAVFRALSGMAQAGLLKKDTLLNAFVRYKVADHSRVRLDRILAVDRKLVDVLAVEDPDPEGWLPLSLRLLNQRLVDEGLESSTELVRCLLRSLSEDGRGFGGSKGSLELRYIARDSYRVRVGRSWSAINELAEKRRRVATVVVDLLLAKVPPETPPRADLLVEFSFEELRAAVERDLLLRSDLKDLDAALERALMYLHEQRVIVLQKGMAIFRAAMRIRMQPGGRGEKYQASHYEPLKHHYGERVLQVHVMSEYARRGMERIREALDLVLAYFTMDKEVFIRRFLATKLELLEHATTAQSYQRIVTDLGNAAQIKIVTAPASHNLLILAGPGSGKTRTVVHRCAYLLRVERARPSSILVCCFNRNAALELRRRLTGLVADDARGVTVLTYHGLAMRLLGYSFAGRVERSGQEIDFEALIADAVKLLRGERVPPGVEADEVRDRLLAGFQYILVDEYQDIDQSQYELISALAGRKLDDPDLKLSILAVGDDDQNIYGFRGANVEFIRRFQQDYQAEPHYLVENYRSTRHIIATANHLIAANTDRMKTAHPIRIDRRREKLAAGGDFGLRDQLTGGKVQVIAVADDAAQAFAVVREIQRLRELGVASWSGIAVLSSTWQDLARVRALAEQEGVPVRWPAGRGSLPPFHQIREVRRFLDRLAEQRAALCRASDLSAMATTLFAGQPDNPWIQFVQQLLEAWQSESCDAELSAQDALEFFYEACADSRREFSHGDGVILSTVHSAKGTEHDHVLLIGPWPLKPERAKQEEDRRAFYVGLTRARKTLAVFDRLDFHPSLPGTLNGPTILQRDAPRPSPELEIPRVGYTSLGLDDLHLGFPGRFPTEHPIHAALVQLQPGDRLTMARVDEANVCLLDPRGTVVARLSQKAAATWLPRLESIREIRVLALARRTPEQDPDEARRSRYQVAMWEIPLVEVVFSEAAA